MKNGKMWVVCKKGDAEDGDMKTIMISPFCGIPADAPGAVHWNELRLRYSLKDGKPFDPTWIVAVSYCSGLPGDDRVRVIDLLSDEFFNQ